MMEARARAGGQPPAQPGQEAKPEDKAKEEKKPDEGEKKKEEEDKSVKRPEKPPRVPDPREFDVALGPDNKVPPFNFIGQSWPDVLQWLANISKSSLDWQELPSDYLNLTTQRAYTLDEVRELVNRHLHARGYTLIQSGEVLSVFKIEKIDPSALPRVTEDELYDLRPYEFVKVSFEMPEGMEVEKAKEDVKQVLSPNAKVFPLVTTKRILVIDAVANLRMVSALLNEERLAASERDPLQEFYLEHARAEEVINVLYVVLGLDPRSRPNQMELQLQQKQLELMQQMQQKGTDVSKMLKQDGPPVYLAFNRQRNSVIAHAPPEQMKLIEETIDYLDVPYGAIAETTASASEGPAGSEFKKYPLATLDADEFVMTLKEIGGLDPYTQLRADAKGKMIFVQGTPQDHEKIEGLIDQFDGTGRSLKVIWLRRLPADAVATTIFNLMVGQEEEEDEDDRPPWYYGYSRDRGDDDKPKQGFRVDADIENNRLLLWANKSELELVEGFLAQLGELPSGQRDPRPVRFIQPGDSRDTAELLKRLRDAWQATGQNELIIKLPAETKTAPADAKDAKKEDKKAEQPAPATDRSAAVRMPAGVLTQLAQLQLPARNGDENPVEKDRAEADAEENAAEATEAADEPSAPGEEQPAADAAPERGEPPVTVSVTNDGRIMISSPDMEALDRVEELLDELSPPAKRFKVYHLDHISALNMWWNLTDFFEDELKGEQEYMLDWYGRTRQVGEKETPTSLSRRRKLMITYDTPSNTILVANASPSQQREIEQLIAEYDKEAPADSARSRRTMPIQIRYSKASVIADALKEVYRDLLSSRDKEFASGEQRDRGRNEERVTVIRYGDSESESGGQRPSPVKVGFEGALSVGVDDVANIVIVSVQEELFENVVAMVKQLDEAAAPKATIRVHRVNGNVTAEALKEAVEDAMGTPWLGGRPEERGRGDRGRDRGDRGRDRDRDGDRDGRRGDRDNDND